MPPIPVNKPVVTESDLNAVASCLESGWVSSEGPQVPQFEAAFAALVGRKYAVAVSSGTAALDVAIRAMGIGPGDEVIVPSLTIISCASAIISSGATPVPVDCNLTDWNAHLPDFEAGFSSRTKAVMLVHLYGLCSDLSPILEWAAEKGLMVIEDASQAMGLSYRNQLCGSFGHCSVFSLYANKLITSGEGGMICTDCDEFSERCRAFRNLCFSASKRFWHEDLGWNYRMTAMQAALGRSQLERFHKLVKQKRELGRTYKAALEDIEFFSIAPNKTSYCENVYWVFGLVVDSRAPFSRSEFCEFLSKRQIGTRTFFYGLHEQPALLRQSHIKRMSLPVTERLSRDGLYLPSGLGLSESDQVVVINAVLDFVRRFN